MARNPHFDSTLQNSLSMKRTLFPLFAIGALVVAAAAADVTSESVGFLEMAINPGTGGGRALTVLSFPLLTTTNITGATSGTIDAFTSTTLTCNSANWAAGELSQAATPKVILITSGAAVGRTFLISSTVANTPTALTLASSETADLTTLGIATGASADSYRIFDCHTLSSLFGTPASFAFVGNANPDLADNVLLLINGVWNTYYFNTTLNRWTRRSLGSPDATNQAVKPEAAILFSSIGTTSLTLLATGSAPATTRSDVVSKSGLTFLGSPWPADVTLINSGIQQIPNWQANSNVNSADQVLLLVSGTWSTYWWTGANWRKKGLGSPISDTQTIPAGSGVILSKTTAAASESLLTQAPPY